MILRINGYKTILNLILFILVPLASDGLWWSISNQPIMNHQQLCRRARGIRGPLRTTCRREPQVMRTAVDGSQEALQECRHQFKDHRWNCTSHRKVLKRILMRDTRETAVLNALMAAGVTHALASGCSSGNIAQCSCHTGQHHPHGSNKDQQRLKITKTNKLKTGEINYDNLRTIRSISHNSNIKSNEVILPDVQKNTNSETYQWGGCPDSFIYGYRKARRLMDRRYKNAHRDIRSLVMLHNNQAGRMVVRDSLQSACKCHGLSGSCNFKTCWKRLSPLRNVGEILRDKYLEAVKVISSNDGRGIIRSLHNNGIFELRQNNLVYLEESPDYCKAKRKFGSLGTSGRQCNTSRKAFGSCEVLCCGRPYQTIVREVRENCRCRFHFCCEVTCDTCIFNKTYNYCT